MAERPLSPFWVYKWAYTMTLSILHRATGVALAVSLIGLVVWLSSLSLGADAYASVRPWLSALPFKLILALAVLALIYHLCNGLRHLAWDLGFGFERAQARRSALLVMIVTLIVTAICAYCIFRSASGVA